LPCSLDFQTLVLSIGDRLGLVDQHHRNPIDDPIAPPEAWVVQNLLVGEVQQGALVLRTSKQS
jgi:hypothetical protein